MPRRPAQAAIADENAAEGGVATLDRALSLLACFTPRQNVLTLAELAARTRIAKSTVLRMLASLLHAHLVHRLPDGRYMLGGEIERLHRVFSTSFSLENVVVPVLRSLVERTQESAAFYVPRGEHQRLCLYRIDSPRPVRDHMNAGDLLPLDRGAGGRILQAYAGGGGAMGKRIRAEQFVLLVGDRVPELAGLGAPVFGPEGGLVGALTLTMPASRLDAGYREPLLLAARAITAALGAAWPEPT